jgi:hypothetical protein
MKYDVYQGKKDASLRLATMPGAGLPAHVKPDEWELTATGSSPTIKGVDEDIAARGFCLFRLA